MGLSSLPQLGTWSSCMMPTVFPNTGRQLYLGEGDFSFSLCLRRGLLLPDTALVTCHADQLTANATENASELRELGIEVHTGVDGTCLHKYPDITRYRYDYVIFNFPHTGLKMKIDKCRALLLQLCRSVAPILASNGQFWVTLCAGQGGTPADTVRRSWPNSWQLCDQAAAAGLMIHRVSYFLPQLFATYRSTGNRGRETRGFHSQRGVTHVLVHSRQPPLTLSTLLQRLSPPTTWSLTASHQHPPIHSGRYQLPQYWLWRLSTELPPVLVPEHASDQESYDKKSVSRIALDRVLTLCALKAEQCHTRLYLRFRRRMYAALNSGDARTRSELVFEHVGDDTVDWCSHLAVEKYTNPAVVCTMNDDVIVSRSGSSFNPGEGDVFPSTYNDPFSTRLIVRHTDGVDILLSMLGADGLEQARLTKRSDANHHSATVIQSLLINTPLLSIISVSDGSEQQMCVCVFHIQAVVAHWIYDSAVGCEDRSAAGDIWRHVTRSDLVWPGGVCETTAVGAPKFYCMYSPLHQLDLSFWIDTGSGCDSSCQSSLDSSMPGSCDSCGGPCFDCAVRLTTRCLRAALRHTLVSVQVLDRYGCDVPNINNNGRGDDVSGRVRVRCRALTVRLMYQQLDAAFSLSAAKNLHVNWLPHSLAETLGFCTR